MPYADGLFLSPVPIAIAPGAPVDGGRRRRRRRGGAVADYVSDYIGDGGSTIATEYIGDHYDDVVHEQIPGVHRRRSRHALQLAGYAEPDQLGIFGIKIGGSLGKALKKVDQTRLKVTKAVGKAATSGVGKAIIGGALALTGVGIPLAAGIGAATQAGGTLAKGGKLKDAAKAGLGGAALGAGSAVAGKVVRGAGGAIAKRVAAGRAAKASAATGSALDKLSTDLPGVSLLPTGAAAAPVIKELTQAPVNVLAAEDQTPATQKRVKSSSIASKVQTAQKVLKTGTAAKAKANQAADVADAAAKKADRLAKALEFAKKAGDTLGISQLSTAAGAAQQVAENASAAAETAAAQARTVGNAAEGAAQGAVGGGIFGPIGDFVENNKVLVYGGLAGVGLILLVRSLPSRSRAAA